MLNQSKLFLEPLMNACLLYCERGQTECVCVCAGVCVCARPLSVWRAELRGLLFIQLFHGGEDPLLCNCVCVLYDTNDPPHRRAFVKRERDRRKTGIKNESKRERGGESERESPAVTAFCPAAEKVKSPQELSANNTTRPPR